MSDHVWKIGDWCEWGIERHLVWKLCTFSGGVRLHLVNYSGSTAYTITEDTRLEHLHGVVRTFAESLEKLSLDDDGTPFGVEVTE